MCNIPARPTSIIAPSHLGIPLEVSFKINIKTAVIHYASKLIFSTFTKKKVIHFFTGHPCTIFSGSGMKLLIWMLYNDSASHGVNTCHCTGTVC